MGFVRLSHGEIAILGQPVHRALRQNLVAYVPQSEDVDWTFPVLVEDVVMMGRYGHMGWLRRAKAHDREVVDAALARVGMSDYRHRQIGELSGGQKKRVFLARAIAQQGKVILLDEPFTGVDVQTETQIITLLRELRDDGCTLLVSTHNLGSVSNQAVAPGVTTRQMTRKAPTVCNAATVQAASSVKNNSLSPVVFRPMERAWLSSKKVTIRSFHFSSRIAIEIEPMAAS